MIETFLSMTIVLILLGLLLLVLFAAPWWVTVLVVSGIWLLLNRLVISAGADEEAD